VHYLGNDIVSLSSAANRKSYGNPEYLKRAFSAKEITMISRYPDLPITELIWSCKESAYKVLVKCALRKSFSPGLYEVLFDNRDMEELSSEENIKSLTRYGNEHVYAESMIKSDYIHTLSGTGDLGGSIICGVVKSGPLSLQHESRSTWEFALNRISDELNCNRDILSRHIDPVTGISSLSSINGWEFDISTSHDGGWLSFACAIY